MYIRQLYLSLIICLVLSVGIVQAASDVTFAWDANSESDLAGYRMYQSQTSGVYTFGDGNQVATILVGTETVQITHLINGGYFWVVTAYDTEGLESGPSNEVFSDLVTTPCEINSTNKLAGRTPFPDDIFVATEANSIGNVDLSDHDGIAGHPIIIDGGGFKDEGSHIYGDYYIIKRTIK